MNKNILQQQLATATSNKQQQINTQYILKNPLLKKNIHIFPTDFKCIFCKLNILEQQTNLQQITINIPIHIHIYISLSIYLYTIY